MVRKASRKLSRDEVEQAIQLVDQAEQLIAEVLHPGEWPKADQVERFMKEGRLERTLALYLQAIRLDPLEPAYPWNLASTLARLGLNEIAFALIAQAIGVGEQTGQEEWAGAGEHLAFAETALDAGQGDMAVVAIARGRRKLTQPVRCQRKRAGCLTRSAAAESVPSWRWRPGCPASPTDNGSAPRAGQASDLRVLPSERSGLITTRFGTRPRGSTPGKEVLSLGRGRSSSSRGKSSAGRSRSAISGRYVTRAHAKRSPRTTVTEKK